MKSLLFLYHCEMVRNPAHLNVSLFIFSLYSNSENLSDFIFGQHFALNVSVKLRRLKSDISFITLFDIDVLKNLNKLL